MLIPMGIINEYHEPTTFNGVERPVIDNKLSPTTWREIGLGLAGNYHPAFIKYQLYLVNGISSFDSKGLLTGSQPLRDGRQKGSKSYITSPNFSGKVEYYGVSGLSVGISAYAGKTQSKLYSGIDKNDEALNTAADSSVVGMTMLGVDARYSLKGFSLRGQLYYNSFSNTIQYNHYTRQNGKNNDLGKAFIGYYAEVGYNVFQNCRKSKTELIPFVRYEAYNLHASVDPDMSKNENYDNTLITAGLTYKITKGAVLKGDMQWSKSALADKSSKVLNLGVGVMF
jgi:hypothetical protein